MPVTLYDTPQDEFAVEMACEGFELEDERELYGLAELMKKGLQVDAHSPFRKQYLLA